MLFFKSRLFISIVTALLLSILLYMLYLLSPLFGYVFRFLKAVFTPFLIAIIISYLLNPIVNLLHKRKVPRTVAVLLIYTIFIASIAVIFMNIIPVFMIQLKELNEHLPELTEKVQRIFDAIYKNKALPDAIRNGIDQSLFELENRTSQWISDWVSSITSTIDVVFIIFIVPFLAFYMMKDYKLIEKTVLALVPSKYRTTAVRLVINIDQALGNYIRGQLTVCMIVALLAYIGYSWIKLPYPLLLAIFVALLNIVPYLGPFLGAAPALLVASTVSVKAVLLVALINLMIQIFEGNVLGPQIVGKTLQIHPLMIIFVLIIGGELAGIVGLILAVPIYAVIKVISRHFVAYYNERK